MPPLCSTTFAAGGRSDPEGGAGAAAGELLIRLIAVHMSYGHDWHRLVARPRPAHAARWDAADPP